MVFASGIRQRRPAGLRSVLTRRPITRHSLDAPPLWLKKSARQMVQGAYQRLSVKPTKLKLVVLRAQMETVYGMLLQKHAK